MTIHGFKELQGLKYYLFHPTLSRSQISTRKILAMWSNGLCPDTSSTEHGTSWGSPLTVNIRQRKFFLKLCWNANPLRFPFIGLSLTSGATQYRSNPFLIWQCFRYSVIATGPFCVFSLSIWIFPVFLVVCHVTGLHDLCTLLWMHSSCQHILQSLVLKISAKF